VSKKQRKSTKKIEKPTAYIDVTVRAYGKQRWQLLVRTLCRWRAPHLMTSQPGASSSSSMTARWRCRSAKCKGVCRWLV